jgi:hypothetical protein
VRLGEEEQQRGAQQGYAESRHLRAVQSGVSSSQRH